MTKREWERTQSTIIKDVKLLDLTKFLETHCRYLERMTMKKLFPQPSKPRPINTGIRIQMG